MNKSSLSEQHLSLSALWMRFMETKALFYADVTGSVMPESSWCFKRSSMCSCRSRSDHRRTYSRAHVKQSVVTFCLQETHARDPPPVPQQLNDSAALSHLNRMLIGRKKPYWLSWWKQEIAEMEIKSFVVPGVRIPGGTVCNCRLLSGITPSNLLPSILPPWRPGRDVICGCYAAKWRWHSLHPLLLQYYPCGLWRKMQHSPSAPFPAPSLTVINPLPSFPSCGSGATWAGCW